MDVRSVMTPDVVTVRPETPVREVARLLCEHGITGMPVVDAEGTLLGVVSSADLLPKELVEPRGKRLRRCAEARTAGEAMTAPARCIAPERAVAEAAALMQRHRIQRLPVASPEGDLVGIVTRADLVRAFARPDDEVEQELRELLAGEDVDVDVTAGEVTLRGVVASRSLAEDLVARARRVPGVLGVSSRLLWSERSGGRGLLQHLF